MASPVPTPLNMATSARERKAMREVVEKRRLQEKAQVEAQVTGLIQEYLLEQYLVQGTDEFVAAEVCKDLCKRWPAASWVISEYFRMSPAEAASLLGQGPAHEVLTAVTRMVPVETRDGGMGFHFHTEVRNSRTGCLFKGEGSRRESAEQSAVKKAVRAISLDHAFAVRHSMYQDSEGQACACWMCRYFLPTTDGRCFVSIADGEYRKEYQDHVRDCLARLRKDATPGTVLADHNRVLGPAGAVHMPGLPSVMGVASSSPEGGAAPVRFAQQKAAVYTDASRALSGHVATAAGVSVDGRFFTVPVRRRGGKRMTSNYCEAIGVLTAIKNWWGVGKALVVHTDSRAVVQGLQKCLAGEQLTFSRDTMAVIEKIAFLVSAYAELGGTIEVQWVPGHSGVHLNEIADRLAHAARFTSHPIVGKDGKHTIFANILADIRAQAPQSKQEVGLAAHG
ncbi:hypothetical protein CPHO_03970 [Corynebacterium phocae]|uniref:ribonuclease H n=1 Tax=Corynebacterium phocae TaxID=161895 RepID=A0A1L7D2C8_9CORY|nr:ribonuclease H family protein [Corynebacterium phocae]APT92182.1 hypothetical protein CPHO_03970 [Corynebacterium phocae]KAA8725759.1 hypothetical protein F4V58_03510 [Corynebacterium phocae]